MAANKANRPAAIIGMLAGIFWPLVAAIGGDSTPSAEEQKYRQALAAIKAFQESLGPEGANDLAKYKEFADPIQKKWSQRNREDYARLTLAICEPLSSGSFKDTRQYGLARKYALLALANSDVIPVTLELELVSHVTSSVNEPEASEEEEFSQRRGQDVAIRLHAWKRLVDVCDTNWNPSEVPRSPNAVAADLGLPSGIAVEGVRDPALRAQYEAAIERNRDAIEKYTQQTRFRDLLPTFSNRAEGYIVWAYSKPPYNLAELKRLLKDSVADDATKARILDAVAKRTGEEWRDDAGTDGTSKGG